VGTSLSRPQGRNKISHGFPSRARVPSRLRDGGAGGGRDMVPGDGATGDGTGESTPSAAGRLRSARGQPLVLPCPRRQPQALGGAHRLTIPNFRFSWFRLESLL